MVHVHGVRAQELSARTVGVALGRLVAVAGGHPDQPCAVLCRPCNQPEGARL